MRHGRQQVKVGLSVVAVRFLITPGVVEVDPVNKTSGLLQVLVDGSDKFAHNGEDDRLVLLGVDGQRDEPHEDRAVCDDRL